MGLRPTTGDERTLAEARGSVGNPHCKQSRDREGADVLKRQHVKYHKFLSIRHPDLDWDSSEKVECRMS